MSPSVLIVDDQALVRAGFRMILEAEEDMEVVGRSRGRRGGRHGGRRLKPDVVLMDVRMPNVDGIEATRQLLAEDGSGLKVVMLTTFDMDEYVYDALRVGASGFLLKDVPPEQLVDGIRAVAKGDALLAPSVTRRVIEEFVRRPPASLRTLPPKLAELTPRELEVLKLIARGLSNAEIAGAALRERGDCEDPRRARPHEARPARPRPSGRGRLRVGPRRAGRVVVVPPAEDGRRSNRTRPSAWPARERHAPSDMSQRDTCSRGERGVELSDANLARQRPALAAQAPPRRRRSAARAEALRDDRAQRWAHT